MNREVYMQKQINACTNELSDRKNLSALTTA